MINLEKKGFTLVELIMVIAIIVILAAIAIPKFIDINNNAKNAADEHTIRNLKATASLLYLKSQAEGDPVWPTGSEINEQVPNTEMTTSFETDKWRYNDTGDTVIFYCRHGLTGSSSGRRWWTYYRTDSAEYKAGNFVEGDTSTAH
jgi:prepilin-type N-terminal cleavage/methylation domain-containing protein